MQYPNPLRRNRYHDAEQDRSLRFLTNIFDLPAVTVCLLYKSRWQVELLFKWIKQHLRIKAVRSLHLTRSAMLIRALPMNADELRYYCPISVDPC
jgi:IS4 transposase